MATDAVGVLGDLVGSRRAPSRLDLQEELVTALRVADAVVPGLEPLSPTLGDEFQGRYADLQAALVATLVVQLVLGADRVRFGIGVGALVLHDPDATPLRQDGPMWWSARAAIDAVAGAAPRFGTRVARWDATRGEAAGDDGPGVAAGVGWANATVVLRDHLVAALRARDRAIALALLRGDSQAAIASREGVSPSAVSQRVRAAGLRALLDHTGRLLHATGTAERRGT